jgi:hypothetical protein
MLDIIFERIFVALPEIPQVCGASRHFPNTQDHNPEEVEEKSK